MFVVVGPVDPTESALSSSGGAGTGAITYVSSVPAVAAVDVTSGAAAWPSASWPWS